MSTRLYVRLDRDAPVPGHRCEWILRDARGAELQRGRSRLDALPRATGVVGVLAQDLVLVCAVELPPGRRARTPAALANAIEPYLLSDPRANHVVALGATADAKTLLAAIARTWLTASLAAFVQAGRPLAKLIVESTLIAPLAGTCVVVCRTDGGFLVGGDAQTLALDAAPAGEIPAGLASYLQSASAMRTVRVHHDHAALPVAAWQATLDRTVVDAGRWDWAQATGPTAGVDVKSAPDILAAVHREAAVTGSVLGRWHMPLYLAGAIAVLHLGATAAQWVSGAAERTRLREQMHAQFRQSVSAAEPLVDPVLQTRRALAAAQRQAGQYAIEDFMSLLGRLAQDSAGIAPASLRAVNYSAGVLTCEWHGAPAAAVERLAVQLRAKGMRADMATDAAAIRLTIRVEP